MKTVLLQLSKELLEAGYPQEDSSFYWITNPWNGKSEVIYYQDRQQLKDDFIDKRYNLLASPTADEILDQLPASIMTEEDAYELGLEMRKVGEFWEINYEDINDVDNGGFHDLEGFSDKSLVDGAALMWLYLKKEGLL